MKTAILILAVALPLGGCQWLMGGAGSSEPAAVVNQKVGDAAPHTAQATQNAPQLPAGAALIGYGSFSTMTLASPGRGVIFFVEDGTNRVVWASYIPDATQTAVPLSQAPLEFCKQFKEDATYRIYFQLTSEAPKTLPVIPQANP